MPSKTFFNLSEEKKKKIEEASLQEFSKYTYDQISINRIIQSIDMPRGSFYLYFTDKDDLYFYIIDKYHDIFTSMIMNVLDEEKSSITSAYLKLFDTVVDYCQKGSYGAMLKHLLMGLNHNIENKMKKLLKNDKRDEIVQRLKEQFKDTLAYTNDEDIKDIIFILNNILIHSLGGYFIFNIDLSFVKERLTNQLTIINQGISKK